MFMSYHFKLEFKEALHLFAMMMNHHNKEVTSCKEMMSEVAG